MARRLFGFGGVTVAAFLFSGGFLLFSQVCSYAFLCNYGADVSLGEAHLVVGVWAFFITLIAAGLCHVSINLLALNRAPIAVVGLMTLSTTLPWIVLALFGMGMSLFDAWWPLGSIVFGGLASAIGYKVWLDTIRAKPADFD
jgi:hypothetical protein